MPNVNNLALNSGNRPVSVDTQSNLSKNSTIFNNNSSNLSKISEFKTSSSNLNQSNVENGGSFSLKKSPTNKSSNQAQTNGDSGTNNNDDFGLFVTKIESKPDENLKAQSFNHQNNTSTSNKTQNTKKKVEQKKRSV